MVVVVEAWSLCPVGTEEAEEDEEDEEEEEEELTVGGSSSPTAISTGELVVLSAVDGWSPDSAFTLLVAERERDRERTRERE